MERYDYEAQMREDIREAVEELRKYKDFSNYDSVDEIVEFLNDELWADDSVTGNGSGSYFFSRWQAEEAICHNLWLYEDCIEEFGGPAKFDPESIDVSIRCYLLSQVLQKMADDGEFDDLIEDEEEEEEEESEE